MSAYRYRLSRTLTRDVEGDPATVLFVMLNPSTATDTDDDPTIRRCMGFTREWGYERLEVVNLFAWRATRPRDLDAVDDPVGDKNDAAIVAAARGAALIVCAWGSSQNRRKLVTSRARDVRQLLLGHALHILDLTTDGQPRHPLYLRSDLRPQLWIDTAGADVLRGQRHALGCTCSMGCEMRAFRARARARRELRP